MSARDLWLALALLMACHTPTPTEPSPSKFPATIELSPEFTGDPVRIATLESGIVVELLAEGEGKQAIEGNVVLFAYDIIQSSMECTYCYPYDDERLRIGDETNSTIHAVLQLVLAGQRAGARARVFVPSSFAPTYGDMWMTVAIEQVRKYHRIVGLDAFAGEPIATKVFDDGLEIHEYAPGEGRLVAEGDLVELVMIELELDGVPVFHEPQSFRRIYTLEGDDWHLAGARVGTLRKLVIPRGYKSENGAEASEEGVMYLQIMWIEPQVPLRSK